jgi:hypothetical protein
MNDMRYYLPGIALIAISVIIVAIPEILIAMIAACVIFAGTIALYIGHMMRKGFSARGYIHDSMFDEAVFNQPFLRRWYSKF